MSTSLTHGERFIRDLDTSGDCWIWTRQRDKDGYGRISIDDRPVRVHRFAWELLVGPLPPGMFVLHHCDTPPCARPSHLFLGDATINAQDRDRKRRLPYGENHKRAKLTEDDVRFIRKTWRTSTIDALADRFGVDRTTIWQVARHQTWRHIP